MQSIYVCYCHMELAMSLNTSSEHTYDCTDGLICGIGTITLSTVLSHIPLNHFYKVNATFHKMVHRDISLSVYI